jgi:hypothetical protein
MLIGVIRVPYSRGEVNSYTTLIEHRVYSTKAVRRGGSHDWCKLRRVFSELQFFAAPIKREDGGQTPEPQLALPENPARGF